MLFDDVLQKNTISDEVTILTRIEVRLGELHSRFGQLSTVATSAFIICGRRDLREALIPPLPLHAQASRLGRSFVVSLLRIKGL
jgi:hypothetical protein